MKEKKRKRKDSTGEEENKEKENKKGKNVKEKKDKTKEKIGKKKEMNILRKDQREGKTENKCLIQNPITSELSPIMIPTWTRETKIQAIKIQGIKIHRDMDINHIIMDMELLLRIGHQ